MDNNERKKVDKSMREILIGKQVPKTAFILILLIYALTTILLQINVRADGVIMIFGRAVPKASFMGVYSSVGNICLIFLVILFRKTGYITSMILLIAQYPVLLIGFFKRNSVGGVPGVFSNTMTIIAITVIYINYQKGDKYQKKIRNQAITDTLTQLPNRFAIHSYIESLMRRSEKFAVVSINLKNFKNINETMGRDFGDKLLIEIAERWKQLSYSGDTGTNDVLARLTGDEFSVIIRDYHSYEDVENSIREYKNELEKKMTVDDCDYFMTASFGYAIYPDDVKKGVFPGNCADVAMKEAKKHGNAQSIIRFKPEFINSEKSMEVERKLRNALDEDKISFHLQPQFDMNHHLRGFEALARLKDEDGSYISPVDFIPVAEKTGLIDKVDISVFKKSIKFLERMMKERGSDFTISANVSVRHLMKNNFLDEIRTILQEHDVPADHIEIEITESIMIDSVEKALQCINEIKEMGMKVAIDDFGTGYSSLSYLNNFPADMLKIDKSFIDLMNTNESSRQYVATIISIGHILNLEVISEGVEDPAQIEVLKNNGCDYIQGYVWGKPMPPEEAEKLLVKLAA